MSERVKRVRELLTTQKIDAVVVSKTENLRYVSGFSGDSATLIVTKKNALIVTDSRYTEQAAAEAKGFAVAEQKDGLLKKTAELLRELSCRRVGFEGNALIFDDWRILTAAAKEIDFSPVKIEHLRETKDETEISAIKKACAIADAAFAEVLGFLRPGLRENEVAAQLEYFMRKRGAERPSFTTIVASGVRGSLPHGTATNKLINDGEFVTMDFGAVYDGYCSDITRTVAVGKADARQKEVYAVALEAQLAGLAALRAGKSGIEVDRAARDSMGDYAQYFGHSLGHGVGLEIHENPRLSSKSKCESLPINAVVTVEPGIYIPGWGGLRIEDTVRVTATGCERLTLSPKELIEV